MIEFRPTEDEQGVLDQVRRFAAKHLRLHLRTAEETGIAPPVVTAYLGLGVALAEYPEAVGGAGLGFVARVLIEEELAFGDVGISAGLPGPDSAGQVLLALDVAELDRWLRPFEPSLPRYGTLAIWEAGAIRAQTPVVDARLERHNGGYRLTGSKVCVAHAQDASLHLVVCRCEGMPAIVALPDGAPVSTTREESRLGLLALPSASVGYEAVEIGENRVLAVGQRAADGISAALARIRLIAAARVLGAARASLAYAVRYAQERQTFGRPIADHQGIAFMIADMTIAADAARLSVWRAARAIDEADPQRERLAALSVAQAFDAGLVVTSGAVQVLGGHGYVQDHPVEKWMRDVRTMISWWGEGLHQPATASAS